MCQGEKWEGGGCKRMQQPDKIHCNSVFIVCNYRAVPSCEQHPTDSQNRSQRNNRCARWIWAHHLSNLVGSQHTAHQNSHHHSLDLSAPLVITPWISAHRSPTLDRSQRTAHQQLIDLSAPFINTHWISAHRSSTLIDLTAPLIITCWIWAHHSSTLTGYQRTAREHSLDLNAPLINTHWISAHHSWTLTRSQRTTHQHSLDLSAPLINTHWISAHHSWTLPGSQCTARQHWMDLNYRNKYYLPPRVFSLTHSLTQTIN